LRLDSHVLPFCEGTILPQLQVFRKRIMGTSGRRSVRPPHHDMMQDASTIETGLSGQGAQPSIH
jgi:hypothetical protein